MKINNFYLLFFLLLMPVVNSCSAYREAHGEHFGITVTNQSEQTIYVSYKCWIHSFQEPPMYVPAYDEIKTEPQTYILRAGDSTKAIIQSDMLFRTSWEERFKYGSKDMVVYILDAQMVDNMTLDELIDNPQAAILTEYSFPTIKELQDIDFTIVYSDTDADDFEVE